MSIILRTPTLATEKRVLSAPSKVAAQGMPEHVQEQGAHADAETTAAANLTQQLEQRLLAVEQATETVSARAYEEGYESGLRKGEADGREAYTSGLQQLEELTQNLNGAIQRGLEESEDMMVAIVYEAVCKIVGDSLATKEGVVAVVREAMGRVRGKSSVIIRVNPIDLELIEESAAFGVASETDWRADESIPMGGCVIESEYGTLDARIETQLNQLKRVLLAARHRPADRTEPKRAE